MALFNRKILRQNRNRVAKNFSQANFLHQEITQIILETIQDCKRNFENVLEIGARNGELGKKINASFLVQTDCSHQMILKNNHHLKLVMDDELPCFKKQLFDLIISNLNLHFVNDIPQNLIEIKKLLKPGGLFIASFFGEQNLKELREVFYQTEQKFYNGITPRIAPNIDIKTMGMILQKAGFADVVVEKYNFEVEYSDIKKLLQDLKNMGEANVLEARSQKFITKKILFDLTETYKSLYSMAKLYPSKGFVSQIPLATKYSSDFQGGSENFLATFEIIILTGWKKN